ncbi:MAG: hypothetical protein AVDCRST_MAG73-3103, partial [uncultured Thermomicrobiales bacterium]
DPDRCRRGEHDPALPARHGPRGGRPRRAIRREHGPRHPAPARQALPDPAPDPAPGRVRAVVGSGARRPGERLGRRRVRAGRAGPGGGRPALLLHGRDHQAAAAGRPGVRVPGGALHRRALPHRAVPRLRRPPWSGSRRLPLRRPRPRVASTAQRRLPGGAHRSDRRRGGGGSGAARLGDHQRLLAQCLEVRQPGLPPHLLGHRDDAAQHPRRRRRARHSGPPRPRLRRSGGGGPDRGGFGRRGRDLPRRARPGRRHAAPGTADRPARSADGPVLGAGERLPADPRDPPGNAPFDRSRGRRLAIGCARRRPANTDRVANRAAPERPGRASARPDRDRHPAARLQSPLRTRPDRPRPALHPARPDDERLPVRRPRLGRCSVQQPLSAGQRRRRPAARRLRLPPRASRPGTDPADAGGRGPPAGAPPGLGSGPRRRRRGQRLLLGRPRPDPGGARGAGVPAGPARGRARRRPDVPGRLCPRPRRHRPDVLGRRDGRLLFAARRGIHRDVPDRRRTPGHVV